MTLELLELDHSSLLQLKSKSGRSNNTMNNRDLLEHSSYSTHSCENKKRVARINPYLKFFGADSAEQDSLEAQAGLLGGGRCRRWLKANDTSLCPMLHPNLLLNVQPNLKEGTYVQESFLSLNDSPCAFGPPS